MRIEAAAFSIGSMVDPTRRYSICSGCGHSVADGVALFPQDFAAFKQSAQGYMLRGMVLQDINPLDSVFLQLDVNNDGLLSAIEYQRLPNILVALDAAALAMSASSSNSSSSSSSSSASSSASSSSSTNGGSSSASSSSSYTNGYRRLGSSYFERFLEEYERSLQALPPQCSLCTNATHNCKCPQAKLDEGLCGVAPGCYMTTQAACEGSGDTWCQVAAIHQIVDIDDASEVSQIRRMQQYSNGQAGSAAVATTSGSNSSSVGTTTVTVTPAPAAQVRPEACGAMFPAMFYCTFDKSCKSDCKECGWKSAADTAFYQCVRPTALTCHADKSQEFCPTDQACKPDGDCNLCLDRPIVDHTSHMCLAVWWKPEPPTQWTDWVCRDRNKVGMPCRGDQDCIYGLKRCLGGKCQPLQPYNQNLTCETDFDCPHEGYFCQVDPTGGENIYWVQYCRRQNKADDTCSEDRECVPSTLCNTAEAQPRCRTYFSRPIGALAKADVLCELGWRDKFNKCAAPAKSKEVGRPCDYDSDCITTDSTGRTGVCACKSWWDVDDSKYCKPVTGDFKDYWKVMRNWIDFRVTSCGNHWSEEECLRVFGSQAVRLKLAYLCEEQTLSGGPWLPPSDCGIPLTDKRFPDYCSGSASQYFDPPR
jgi:hypothetical protein